MIRINLLPVRQTKKIEALRREILLAGVAGALVCGLCLFVWAGLSIRLASVSSENAKLDAEILRLAEDVKRVDEMEKFKAELERKLAVIDSLRAKKEGPAHMLEEIALAAPEKLTLTGVREHSNSMEILGLAVSNEVISQFLRSLEASEYFEQVYLQNIEAAPTKDKTSPVVIKEFSLTAKRVDPKAVAKAAAEAKAKAEKEAPAGAAPAGGAPAGGTPAPAAPGEAAPAAPAAPESAAPAPAAAGGTQ